MKNPNPNQKANSNSRGIFNNNSRNNSNRSSRSPDRRMNENSTPRANLDTTFQDLNPSEERSSQDRTSGVRFDFSNLDQEINDVREGNNLDQYYFDDERAQQNQTSFNLEPDSHSHPPNSESCNSELMELKSKLKLLSSQNEFLKQNLEFNTQKLENQTKENESQATLISVLRSKNYNQKVNNEQLSKTNKELNEKLRNLEFDDSPLNRRNFNSDVKMQEYDEPTQSTKYPNKGLDDSVHSAVKEVHDNTKKLNNQLSDMSNQLRVSCNTFTSNIDSQNTKVNLGLSNNLNTPANVDSAMSFFSNIQNRWEQKFSIESKKKLEHEKIKLETEKELLTQDVKTTSKKLQELNEEYFFSKNIYTSIHWFQNSVVLAWMLGFVAYLFRKQ